MLPKIRTYIKLLTPFILFSCVSAFSETETLTVTYTASPAAGEHWPSHVDAVWLEEPGGNYVKTLYRWGYQYAHDIRNWAIRTEMAVDGMSGATRARPISSRYAVAT